MLKALGASMMVSGLAGCSSDDSTDDGSGGGDDNSGPSGTDGGTTDDDSGDNPDSGATGPKAAVETYIEAGQDGDSEAMSAIVHPDGTAATSPEEGGTANITVNSMTTVEGSDTQATVEVDFELTVVEDGEEQTRSAVTTYDTRTHEGWWFVYSISEPTFENGDGTTGTDGQGETEELSPSEEDLGDPDGSVGENTIDELVVMALDSFGADGHEEAPQDRFTVEVTLGNNGEQATDLGNYTYSLDVTTNEGDTVDLRIKTANLSGEVPPGETGTIAIWDYYPATLNYYESYKVNIDCSDGAGGVYCLD
jgi:hypothetical protein